MSKNLSYETAYKKITKKQSKPFIIEALWDGDSRGWFLCFFVYEKQYFKTSRYYLGSIELSDEMLGYEQISKEAYKITDKLKQEFSFEFFFPSPDQPDDDCPHWDERHKAINCADCNKLIIPTDSEYLPKHICYNCHLEQESREKFISNEKLHYCTLYMLFGDEENCVHFSSGSIEHQSINEILCKIYGLNTDELSSKGVIKKASNEVDEIISEIESQLEKLLLSYSKPEVGEKEMPFSHLVTMSYKEKDYEFELRWNHDALKPFHLIQLYNKLNSMKAEDNNMYVVFNKDLSYRGDIILRFLRTLGAPAKDKIIFDEYEKFLSKEVLKKTLNELETLGYLIQEGECVKLSFKGKHCN